MSNVQQNKGILFTFPTSAPGRFLHFLSRQEQKLPHCWPAERQGPRALPDALSFAVTLDGSCRGNGGCRRSGGCWRRCRQWRWCRRWRSRMIRYGQCLVELIGRHVHFRQSGEHIYSSPTAGGTSRAFHLFRSSISHLQWGLFTKWPQPWGIPLPRGPCGATSPVSVVSSI